MRGIVGIIGIIGAALAAGAADASQIQLRVEGLRSDLGTVRVALYDHPETYDDQEGRVEGADVSVAEASKGIVFADLPPGDYAITLFHDENNNDEMDLGLFFIPMEGYGFSNDAEPGFSKPDFDEVKFPLGPDEDLPVVVTMQY